MNSRDAKVKDVRTGGGKLTVWLDDGRVLALPLSWYPSLAEATVAERATWRPCGAGHGIHWPALDYDLDIEGLLAGCREAPAALAYTRRFRALKGARTTMVLAEPDHKVQSLRFQGDVMELVVDGRRHVFDATVISPRIAAASAKERNTWEVNGSGYGIHWPLIDEDLSIDGLLAGRRSGECAESFQRWLQARAKKQRTRRKAGRKAVA